MQHNLKLELSKCMFMHKETQYLGFLINEDGIIADPDKVKVMRWMLPPTCLWDIRSFIGICSYYRRFIPNFSAIAKLLIRLTKKFAKFEWSKECQTAFDLFKESLTTVPVLAYPDTSKPYILYTDISDDCIWACLCQEQDTEGEIYQCITSCITCHTRNLGKVKPLQQETDTPPYPFAELGLDVSEPYPKTLSGNKCIIGFVD